MAYREDVEIVKRFFKEKYGCAITISQVKDKQITADDPRVVKWLDIVSNVMGCKKDYLMSKGRTNNSHEKIWFRYMLITQEGIALTKLYPLLHLKDHSTLSANLRVCQGWTDVYPELYSKLLDLGLEYDKINDLKCNIYYETNTCK
jgi:hypothetical protein